MNMNTKRNTLQYNIRRFSIFLLGCLLFVFLSPLADKTLGDTGILPIAALYFVTQWKAFPRVPRRNLFTISLAVAYMAMILLYRVWGFSDATMSMYFTTFKFHLCFACMVPVSDTLSRRETRFLLAVAIGSLLLTMVSNVHLQAVYGARFSMRAFREEGLKGIISTQYTTAVLLIAGAFLAAALHANTTRRRILFWTLLAACVWFNLKVGQRGIVFFLSFVLYGLVFVFNKPLDKRRVLRLLAAAAAAVLLFMRADPILGWLSSNVSSERLQARITAVQGMLSHKSVKQYGGSFSRRMELIGNSWDTFRESPQNFLVGVGDIRNHNRLVGNHSYLADELARYGILGGLLSFWLLFRQLCFVRTAARTAPRSVLDRQLGCIFFVLFLRSCLGSVVEMSNGVGLFFIIPLVFRTVREWETGDIPQRRVAS